MDYDRYDAFLHHIFKQTQGDAWFRPNEDTLSAGVALRINDTPEFRVFPYEVRIISDSPSIFSMNVVIMREYGVHELELEDIWWWLHYFFSAVKCDSREAHNIYACKNNATPEVYRRFNVVHSGRMFGNPITKGTETAINVLLYRRSFSLIR